MHNSLLVSFFLQWAKTENIVDKLNQHEKQLVNMLFFITALIASCREIVFNKI